MTTPSYPITLLPPNAKGFTFAKKTFKAKITTDMDSVRDRRMVSSNVYVITSEFFFKQDSEFTEFQKWFKYDINYGDYWFEADWFSDIGLESGKWAFRFVNLPVSSNGYSMSHSCTILAGPREENFVNSEYTELPAGGPFVNAATLIDYTFLFALFDDNFDLLYPVAYSNLNNYPIAPLYSTGLSGSQYLTCLSNTRLVFFSRNTTAGPTVIHLVINVVDMSSGVITPVTSADFLAHATIRYEIDDCTLSSDELAVVHLPDPSISVQPSCQLERINYSGGVWTLVGAAKTIVFGYNTTFAPSITSLSANRVVVAFSLVGDSFIHLQAYDWNGAAWVEVGAVFTTAVAYPLAIQRKSIIKSLSGTDIVLSEYTNSNIHRFSFNGAAWSLVSTSTIGSFDSFCVLSENKIVGVIGTGLIDIFKTYNYIGSSFSLEVNEIQFHSYFSTVKSINSLPRFMVT